MLMIIFTHDKNYACAYQWMILYLLIKRVANARTHAGTGHAHKLLALTLAIFPHISKKENEI